MVLWADDVNQRGLPILLVVVDHGRCWLIVTGGVRWGGRACPPKLRPSFPSPAGEGLVMNRVVTVQALVHIVLVETQPMH